MTRLQPKVVIPVSAAIIIAVIILGWLFLGHDTRVVTSSSPVPQAIRTGVSFPVYSPDTSKLPHGYSLDMSSFSSGAGVVEFVVKHGSQKLIFTEQAEPSYQQLQVFVAQRLPLHDQINLPLGTATIGAIGNNTFVSLPTNYDTWIIMTGPYATDRTQLKQVLQSLTR